jgi:toxin ParE1/3/4
VIGPRRQQRSAIVFRTTPEADNDLAAIYEYGAVEFGPGQAEAYLEDLRLHFLFLAANPYAFRERAELSPPMRLCRFRAHEVIYVVVDEDVLIVRVLGARQDWHTHLE